MILIDKKTEVALLNNEAIQKMGMCRARHHAPSLITGVQASRSWATFGEQPPDIVVVPASTSHLPSGSNRRRDEGRT
jgi:hypothetical protein